MLIYRRSLLTDYSLLFPPLSLSFSLFVPPSVKNSWRSIGITTFSPTRTENEKFLSEKSSAPTMGPLTSGCFAVSFPRGRSSSSPSSPLALLPFSTGAQRCNKAGELCRRAQPSFVSLQGQGRGTARPNLFAVFSAARAKVDETFSGCLNGG